MIKGIWKVIVPVVAAIGLTVNNIWADGSVAATYRAYAAEKSGYIYVSSVDEWLNEINWAKSQLKDEISLCIVNFDKDAYDLSQASEYNISIKASGEVRGVYAYVKYTFEYSDNYMLIKAQANPMLRSCLDTEQIAVLDKVSGVVAEITDDTMTDYEKEKAIHDYIVLNYQYDVEGVENNTLTLRGHSITGLVVDGKGVCEAYANLFMLMCNMSGVECSIVTGVVDGVDHAWNIVKLDDEYYHVDVTNDDPVPDQAGRVRYTYFNLSDDELTGYTISDRQVDSCTGTKYNYYNYNNLVVTNYDELKALADREIAAGKTEFTFRTKKFVLNSSTYIKQAVSNKGFSKITVYGQYGTDNTYYIILE